MKAPVRRLAGAAAAAGLAVFLFAWGRASAPAARLASVPAAAPHPSARKVLFYRNPMDPKVTSPVFRKDEMGMDYLPVYAEPAAAAPANVAVAPEPLRLAGVATAPAVSGTLGRAVRTSGVVVPDETRIRHVHAKISGWIETLYASATGQRVRAGQPLLTVYSPELLATQEEYLRAKETAARFRGSSLPEVRRGGEELLEAARRRLELFDVPRSFLARLDRTGRPERAVPLLAPASGYATGKEVFAGQQINPAMELYTLTDLSRVWVEASFSEAEAQALQVGQPVRVSLPYGAGREIAGRIGFLAPALAAESRTLQARIELANPGLALRPGMYVDVATELGSRSGTVVPDSAVIDSGLRQIAFVETGPGAFEPREVRVGLRADGKALLLSGVSPGERVATRANFLLDSESRLRGALEAARPAAPPSTPEARLP